MSPISQTVDTAAVPAVPSAFWVDPAALPAYSQAATPRGSAPMHVKQLTQNTLFAYGVGSPDCFAHRVGRAVRLVDVSIDAAGGRAGRMEATTVAEVVVERYMLNGAEMLHGGCIAYLIDNCCSTPLVALGLAQGANGVGVTQALNVLFHAPAPLGTRLIITSTSVALGGRVMSARCEIVAADSGRVVASALLTKMQPAQAKM